MNIDHERIGGWTGAGRIGERTPSNPDDEAELEGRGAVWLAVRALGALSLLAVGAVHLQQYVWLYSAIPTIGPLFLLNFLGASALGIGLLAPVERLLPGRGRGLVMILALGGVVLAGSAYVFLWIAERTPVFGFMEPGYDPTAILVARLAEAATVTLLGSFLIARLMGRGRAGRW